MNESDRNLSLSQQRWESDTRAKYVKENPERSAHFQNDIGLEIKPVYTPLDLSERGFNYEEDLGFPGEFPYTRGLIQA